jgi:SAM-dependent methyltransferase
MWLPDRFCFLPAHFLEIMMNRKETFEQVYSREDPYRFKNSIADRTRRIILLKHLEPVFSDGSRKSILDAGCGEGEITKDIASTFNVDIDAFDISENALTVARRKNHHENINYFQLDLIDFVPDKKYDLILCEEALYYLSDDERVHTIRKFHDAIKPGGYFRLTSIIVGPTRAEKFFTPDALREIVAGNGFQLVSIWPSLLNKSLPEKVIYRLLEYINKVMPFSPDLIAYFVKLALNRPLDKCRSISILARKI